MMPLRSAFVMAVLLALPACTTTDHDELIDELAAAEPVMPDYSGKADGLTTEQLVAVHCPGVTYSAGVTTYKGLAGTYYRTTLAVQGEPVRLTLSPTHDDPDATGTFTGTRLNDNGLLASYAGNFSAITDNPAIGAAMGFDSDSDGQIDRVHFVLGLRRSFGRVVSLCLAGEETPFLMKRWF